MDELDNIWKIETLLNHFNSAFRHFKANTMASHDLPSGFIYIRYLENPIISIKMPVYSL